MEVDKKTKPDFASIPQETELQTQENMTDIDQPPGGDPLTYGMNTSVESSNSKKYTDGKLVPHKQGKKRV